MHKLYVIDLQSCLKWISKVDGIDCKGNCMTRRIICIIMFDIFWSCIYTLITTKCKEVGLYGGMEKKIIGFN